MSYSSHFQKGIFDGSLEERQGFRDYGITRCLVEAELHHLDIGDVTPLLLTNCDFHPFDGCGQC